VTASWSGPDEAFGLLLLERAQSPDRLFDAVVLGEFERAFTDYQFEQVARLVRRRGVLVWLPEAGGPVDLDVPTHRVLVQVLAGQSQQEVVRSRHRAVAAMTAQTIEQGRFLGGRRPYGYQLVDAGPHPNQAHAAWGRRCRRLAPDPLTAPHVRWMFAERLAGRSVAGIARGESQICVPSTPQAGVDGAFSWQPGRSGGGAPAAVWRRARRPEPGTHNLNGSIGCRRTRWRGARGVVTDCLRARPTTGRRKNRTSRTGRTIRP